MVRRCAVVLVLADLLFAGGLCSDSSPTIGAFPTAATWHAGRGASTPDSFGPFDVGTSARSMQSSSISLTPDGLGFDGSATGYGSGVVFGDLLLLEVDLLDRLPHRWRRPDPARRLLRRRRWNWRRPDDDRGPRGRPRPTPRRGAPDPCGSSNHFEFASELASGDYTLEAIASALRRRRLHRRLRLRLPRAGHGRPGARADHRALARRRARLAGRDARGARRNSGRHLPCSALHRWRLDRSHLQQQDERDVHRHRTLDPIPRNSVCSGSAPS